MGLIREPKNVDFTIQSEPWTEEELLQLRVIMRKHRERINKAKLIASKKGKSKPKISKATIH